MRNKLKIVYEPQGKAKEYADLACNLYTTCAHACQYCYVPGAMRKTRKAFYTESVQVKDCIAKFEHDAKILAWDDREIMFSFTSDPYQHEESLLLMEQIYDIAEKNKLRLNILTKAGYKAMKRHSVFFQYNGWKFGSTICFMDETLRQVWEPGAPSIESRIEAVKEAHRLGIYTWVSIEPVIKPQEVWDVIAALKGHVRFWKIGKINHMPELEKKFEWVAFREHLKEVLRGESYYIKKSLTEL